MYVLGMGGCGSIIGSIDGRVSNTIVRFEIEMTLCVEPSCRKGAVESETPRQQNVFQLNPYSAFRCRIYLMSWNLFG
jgi:hypothetical protein